MSLWILWWNAIRSLRPAFTRLQTFLWFATAVAGFTVRTEQLGVTSIVRALNLDPASLTHRRSAIISTPLRRQASTQLTALWTSLVLRLLPQALRVKRPGRRRHQDPQVRPQDAGGQIAASAIGIEHQAGLHHGALTASCKSARSGRLFRLRCAACRAHP